MSLSLLYRSYVELCSQMAASAKSAEIREQWTNLAEQWRQKAEANETQHPLHVGTPNLASRSPTLVPETTMPLQQKPVETPNFVSRPTLVPEATTPLQQKPVAETSKLGELDDIWTKIASPINLEG